jgi:hypothetical protein
MTLKVIGAGYPRTGTTSLKTALELLGFGPCCHMWELLKPENAWRWPLWGQAFDDEPVDWETLYRDFAAAVDAPGCFFWRKLSHAFPEAKVILTVREQYSWLRSMQTGTAVGQAQIDPTRIDPVVPATLRRMGAAIARERGSDFDPPGPMREQFIRDQFLRHIEAVTREIAPERLLVFEVTEGWAPLCRFLGVPEPAEAFPQENDVEDFARRISGAPAAAPTAGP